MRALGHFAGVLLLLHPSVRAQSEIRALVERADELRKKPSRENLERARDLLLDAKSHKADDPKLAAKAVYRLGQVYQALHEHEQALPLLEEALRRFEENGEKDLVPFALHNIAACHLDLGDPAKAVDMFERILPMRQRDGDRAGEGYTLYGIASANWSLGEPAAALEAYRKSLAIWQELKAPNNEAHAHNSMGLIFAMLGDYGRTKASFEQALSLWQKAGNHTAPALAWNNWCLASVGERKYADAIQRCKTALDLARQHKNRQLAAYASHNMANAYAGLRQPQRALELYEQSLDSKREAKDRWGEAATLHAMGEMRLDEDNSAGATALLEQALALRRETGDRAGQVQTLGALARVHDLRGMLPESLGELEEAIGLIEAQRAKLASPDLRATYLASLRDFYDLRVDLLMRSGRAEAALEAAARARGRLLSDRLSDTLAGIRTGAGPALIERQRATGRRLDAQAQLLQQAPTASARHAVERRIDSLLAAYRDLSEQIRVSSPKYAGLIQPESVSVGDLRRLIEPGTVLLQYFLGRERSYVWVLTEESVAAHTLPARARVESEVRATLDSIAAKQESVAATAKLARLLLDPAAKELTAPGARRVVIAADGEIESVPFAALPVEGRPLAARAEIAHLPSAAALKLFREESAARSAPPKQIALFGDPVYSTEDPRFATRASNGTELPRLRFSRVEAESIAKLVPAPARLLALDFEASRKTVERTRLADFRILHFATHSVVDTRAELSGIALSDGFLRLHQIYNLDLRARLVTLSSCRSAVGGSLRGEGLASIARGFLYAGAAAVVGTLWDIDDRATSELMKHFYQEMFVRRMTAAAALRAAQNEIRSRKGWEHPYYWAGFALHGEWR